MPTSILFFIALAVLLWVASIIIIKTIFRESIRWWLFVLFAINGATVITYIMHIW